ncbi:tetratricopeptide repeat protein [Gaoshiqia sp. Z1-71]|uniref:tetratricopeptide repeat protein n=1 Tax=Gaoshiqia hydrogeniformans TaxID=3290090 RepID=UPI003BF8A4F0
MDKVVEQLNNEGVSLFLNGDFEKAKNKYLEALDLFPGYPTTLNNLGMVFLQEKKYQEAKTCFLKASREKENSTYRLNLGHAYANLNRLEEAEQCYLKSVELNPGSLMAWKSLAALYQFQKKYRHSVNVWQNIIGNYSRDPYCKIQLAKDLIALKEYSQALALISEAAGYEQYQDQVWYVTALIYFFQNNFGLAETAVNKAVAMNPGNESYRMLAAAVYLGLSQPDKALGQWDYLLAANENLHHVRIDKAVTLLAHGFRQEALHELNLVLLKDSAQVKALFYKALILMETGTDEEEATGILTALQAGGHDFSAKASELLSKLKNNP